MTHVTCSRLTAKNQDQLQNPTLGGWVWALPFTYTHITHVTRNSVVCYWYWKNTRHWLQPMCLSPFFVHKCHCQTADRRGLLLYALCQDTVASFVCMTVYLNITLGTLTSVMPSLLVSCLLCYYVRSLYCSEFFSVIGIVYTIDWFVTTSCLLLILNLFLLIELFESVKWFSKWCVMEVYIVVTVPCTIACKW